MDRRRWIIGALAVAALVLLAGRWSTALYTDYLWYSSLGAAPLWRAELLTTLALGVASFAAASLFAFLNFWAVRRSVVSLVLPRRIANLEIGEEVPGRLLFFVVVLLSLFVGSALVFPSDDWTTALLAAIGRPFGDNDPYFGADLGFFVYWLPFESAVHLWFIVTLVVVSGIVVALYALTPSLRWERGSLYVSAYVRRHFTMLGAVVLLVLAWSYRLGMYRLLSHGGGTSGTFSSIDQQVVVPATLLLSILTLCAAFVVAWAGWLGQTRIAFLAVTVVLLVSLLSRTVAPLVARRSPDAAVATAHERPYVATRLSFTRRAYGVDRIGLDSLGAGFPSGAAAALGTPTWDGVTMARAAERMRHVRVIGSSAFWQALPAGIAATFVERTTDGATEGRELWGVERFDPTSADERGLPERLTAESRTTLETLPGEPAVYDSAPSYSVMSDSLRHLAGVEMVSTRSRLAHAWSLQNFRLLFGELPPDRPTIVRRRDVRERVAALAPFFVQGGEIVPVVAADSLYWVLELYAAAGSYPLAQRFTILGEERGYFQHAATAVLHAASGRVRLVLSNAADPVASSWAAFLPTLFVPLSALSPALRAVLPPITDAARVQALAFAIAGFRGDSLEVRHFANPDGADSAAAREPLRVALPGATGVSALWPMLDSADRLRGLIVARGGAARITSWLPFASDDNRWGAVVDRLRSADSTTRESGAVRAPLRAVPVGGRPLYFQPVFQWHVGSGPTLSRVMALAGDTTRAGATFAAALGVATQVRRPLATTGAQRGELASSLYRRMRESMRRGDWMDFGRAFDSLGLVLRPAAP